MSPLNSRPTVSPSAKSQAGTTYVQPRAVGSSWICSFAAAPSASSRLVPPRENSVRYGATPPTDRDQPHCSRISAGFFPRSEPSSPWRCDHHARSLDSFIGSSSVIPSEAAGRRRGRGQSPPSERGAPRSGDGDSSTSLTLARNDIAVRRERDSSDPSVDGRVACYGQAKIKPINSLTPNLTYLRRVRPKFAPCSIDPKWTINPITTGRRLMTRESSAATSRFRFFFGFFTLLIPGSIATAHAARRSPSPRPGPRQRPEATN